MSDIYDWTRNRLKVGAGWATKEYHKLSSGLQKQIAETLTGLVTNVMQPVLLRYIEGTYHLRDGTTVHGQSAFDRLVKEDKDLLVLIEKYKPSYLMHIDKARRVRKYILWNNDGFAVQMADYLEKHGIEVTREGYAYLWRTVERFRRRIYS